MVALPRLGVVDRACDAVLVEALVEAVHDTVQLADLGDVVERERLVGRPPFQVLLHPGRRLALSGPRGPWVERREPFRVARPGVANSQIGLDRLDALALCVDRAPQGCRGRFVRRVVQLAL